VTDHSHLRFPWINPDEIVSVGHLHLG
jgi:hypothetical protein